MGRETVIKKAETRKKIGPLMMVMGVVMFFATLVIALLVEGPFIGAMAVVFPQARALLPPPDLTLTPVFLLPSGPRLLVTFLLWLVFLALAYALVAMLAGKDPEGPQALKMVMTGIDSRKEERRRKARMRR